MYKTYFSIWLVVDAADTEYLCTLRPVRDMGSWVAASSLCKIKPLEKGTIELMTGRKMTWRDEPINIEYRLDNEDRS